MALQSAKPDEIGAYIVKQAPKSVSYYANARGFLAEYGIATDPARRFSATKNGNRLLVELDEDTDGESVDG